MMAGCPPTGANTPRPMDTRGRAQKPADNGVIQFKCGKVKEIPPLKVEHEPEKGNRAHTEVYGKKDEEVRVKLGRVSKWVIPLPPNP